MEPEPPSQQEEVKTSAKEDSAKPATQQSTQATAPISTSETKATTPPVTSASTATSVSANTPAAPSANTSASAPAPIPTHIASPTSYSEPLSRAVPPASNGTAYSTQIAQQYSTQSYDQNPGLDYQEYNQYQQRNEISPVDTTGERSRINIFDRSVRPSEMKDEG